MRIPVVPFDLDGRVIDSGANMLASARHAFKEVVGVERADEELTTAVLDQVETARTVVFRTVEDPSVPARPERCPWPDANLFLGGRMHGLAGAGELGVARACARIGGPLVPGAEVPFYAEFDFDGGDRYRAEGSAHVVSDDVPAAGVVLAGSALRLVDGPRGFVGGSASSTSIFNPMHHPGAETGSIWTLFAYFRE